MTNSTDEGRRLYDLDGAEVTHRPGICYRSDRRSGL